VVHIRLTTASALAALMMVGTPAIVSAQQAPSSEWFVPGQPHPATAPPARPAGRPAPLPNAGVPPPGSEAFVGGGGDDQPQPPPLTPQQLQMQLPPAPVVPPVPKGSPTPAAIIGILSVPDVLRISTAYQQGDKEMAARRQKLNEDAQKEQVALRDLGQALANDRAKLTPEQIRTKERELQDRVNESRRKFGERNRIIQEAGQYVMAQIDRTLEQVAQQVALSRGVNLVLNRAQILGTTADFDLTPQVAEVLNQVLPSVVIPPDGVSPLAMAPPGDPALTGSGLIASPGQAAPPAATPAPAPVQPASAPAAKPPQKH
jgi:Skp family chaperone for outer membrane proteins